MIDYARGTRNIYEAIEFIKDITSQSYYGGLCDYYYVSSSIGIPEFDKRLKVYYGGDERPMWCWDRAVQTHILKGSIPGLDILNDITETADLNVMHFCTPRDNFRYGDHLDTKHYLTAITLSSLSTILSEVDEEVLIRAAEQDTTAIDIRQAINKRIEEFEETEEEYV